MAAAGVPLEAITRRLGHADSDITKEIIPTRHKKAERKRKQSD